MKFLSDILYKARITQVVGNTHVAIESLAQDSRAVKPFSLFVAVRGTLTDGHKYIEQAIASGAIAVVCEVLPAETKESVTYIKTSNSAEALGFIAANFYDNPSEKLQIVAITGTNGKTTTATLCYNLFRALRKKAGLLSTVVNKINDKEIRATHTTPDAISLNALLHEMTEQGVRYVFMEASSHAIHQHRLTGTHLAGGVFTNISRDHLDYHGNYNEYIKAKKGLFDMLPASAFALTNTDDKHGEDMLINCKAKHRSFALKTMADYKARVLENQFTGLVLNIENNDLYSRLVGNFNAYNLLTVYAVARELGIDQLDALREISTLESVEGRFQYIQTEQNVTAIVDYAHTPDALKNVLKTIKNIRTGNEQVITLVGCGGDRDKGKRPLMAQIAVELSDKIILTSDNPRSEDPEAIIADMKEGLDATHFKKSIALADRKEAIKLACSMAEPGDIILIAGKGHEKYQEINGERFPFDDFAIVDETLKMLEK